jgi:hypothetical protein
MDDVAADENSNGTVDSQQMREFIRMRKPTKNNSMKHMENIETTNGMDSPGISTPEEEDDEIVKNAAVFQQIALTRVKNHAKVRFISIAASRTN